MKHIHVYKHEKHDIGIQTHRWIATHKREHVWKKNTDTRHGDGTQYIHVKTDETRDGACFVWQSEQWRTSCVQDPCGSLSRTFLTCSLVNPSSSIISLSVKDKRSSPSTPFVWIASFRCPSSQETRKATTSSTFHDSGRLQPLVLPVVVPDAC